jgi:ferric-dicitrate binding protein FerR (iron transport regulator)
MGLSVRALTRRNLIAIAAGIVLAGAPLIAFDFWLNGLIDTQGGVEVGTAARRAVSLADSRLGQVVKTLDTLAAQGVNSC